MLIIDPGAVSKGKIWIWTLIQPVYPG